MDTSEANTIKTLIGRKIQETEEEIVLLKERTQPISPDNAIGRLSRMEAINEQGVAEATLARAELRLKQLRGALNRADDEDFGICAECDEPIPSGRILLLPQTTLCVACAEGKE